MSAECSSGNIQPGYKQTEVGVIPEDWEVKPVNQIGTPVRGGSPRPAGDLRYFNGSYIPWLTVAALTNIPASQLIVSETATFLTEEGSLHSRTLTPGTLIIANSGATLGVAKILGIKCCANDGIAALLNLSKNISPNYLAHFINTKTNYLREVVATGNGQPNLNTELIGNFKIPLPPTKAEQESIAKALSDADAFIESLEQLIAKKRQIKQGAMQELLTGKKRLLEFSGDWGKKRIGDLLTIAHGKSQHAVIDKNGIYPILASGGQIGTANCFLYDKPSVLIGRKGTIDKPQFMDTPFWTVDTLFYSVIHEPNNAKFLFYRFCLIDWKQYNEASGVPSLNARTIESIELKTPSSAEEQNAIATILSDMDSEITALKEKLSKACQIKQGMMQELLTGRIRLI
jgi:type I restriction enzyme S subunit